MKLDSFEIAVTAELLAQARRASSYAACAVAAAGEQPVLRLEAGAKIIEKQQNHCESFAANQQQEQRKGPSPSTIRQSKKTANAEDGFGAVGSQLLNKAVCYFTVVIYAAFPKTPFFKKFERSRTARNARSKQS